MTQTLKIAIDGPASSGKGTLARKLGEYFKLPYLNTGALYRLSALNAQKDGIDLQNQEQLLNSAQKTIENIANFDLEDAELHTESVGKIASQIASINQLRQILLAFQKDFVKNPSGCVLDGRDIASVICPQATHKFFVTASVEERARRRHLQLSKHNQDITYQQILEQLQKRDESDINRKVSPLIIACDALIIDSTKVSAQDLFDRIKGLISASLV